MEKILSARLDDSVILELERVTQKLRITKKKFLEGAIHSHARSLLQDVEDDCSIGFGAWGTRGVTAKDSRRQIRLEFEKTFRRHGR